MGLTYLSSQEDITSSKNNWDTLLIDFDGTLVDYYYSEKMALTDLLFSKNLPHENLNRAINDYQRINEGYWQKFEKDLIDIEQVKTQRFEDLADLYDLEINPSQFNDEYLALFIQHVKPFDGAFVALEKLFRDYHYTLIILTNGIDDVQKQRLELTKFDQIIHYLFTSGGVGYSKPSPEIFDIALQTADSSYERCCMIGDSLSSDIRGAKNLGIMSCLIASSNEYQNQDPQPDMITSSFVDFVNWLTTG